MKKFLFDRNDFDDANAEDAGATYTEEQLVLARQQASTQARDEAMKEAQVSYEAKTAALLDKVAIGVAKMIAEEEARELKNVQASIRLTLAMARKLFPAFAERLAQPEIERVILEAIDTRRDEPRLMLAVAPGHFGAIQEKISQIAHEKGFAGKITLQADEALKPGDVRIEWADGGAERLYERIFAQIEAEFEKSATTVNNMQ